MNESLFAALSCIEIILLVVGLLLIANRDKLIAIEQSIRIGCGKVVRDGAQVVRVVNDFYGRDYR